MQARDVQSKHREVATATPAARGVAVAVRAHDLGASLLRLQRMHGNRFVQRLLEGGKFRRECSCGATCNDCRARVGRRARDESPRSVLPPKAMQPEEADEAKDPRGEFRPAARYSDAMKTECDVRPASVQDWLLGKTFYTVGTGTPEIIELVKDLQSRLPCSYVALRAHEEQHVTNSRPNCQALKQCVDKAAKGLFGGTNRISRATFDECREKHHAGRMPDCIADELSAYEVGIKKARVLKSQPQCKGEVGTLDLNINHWEQIKGNAPNCLKK